MKHQVTLSLFFILFASYITCNNLHDRFILSQKPSLTFYDKKPIHINKKKYQHVIETWEQKLSKTWDDISKDLNTKITITTEQLDTLMATKAFTQLYMINKQNEVDRMQSMYTFEEDTDAEVVTFIKRMLHKICNKKNIKIILTPYIPSLTLTCGSDNGTHYVLCNSILYSAENIKHYYKALTKNNGLFNINVLDSKTIQFIEISNLLLVGILKVASHIEHQSNILAYLISYLLYNNHVDDVSIVRIVKRYVQYTEIRSILESIFQSKNPLETALYSARSYNPESREYKILQKVTDDIAACYSLDSLAKFKITEQELKSLYQDFC